MGLIDDVIVISCREISQEAFAEEKERIRQLKYKDILYSSILSIITLQRGKRKVVKHASMEFCVLFGRANYLY